MTKSSSLPPSERARNIATRVLQDGYDPLLASRQLASFSRLLESVPEEIRLVFVGVDSECDGLPLGHERMSWSLAALREQDQKAQVYREQVRAVVTEACQSLLKVLDSEGGVSG